MDFSSTSPVRLFCANCGAKIIGYKSSDGALRIDCPRCFIKIFSKQKTPREIDIKLKLAN
jgi:DNA-directed RNA polymerase subunit RPC12/RpoP